MSFPALNPVAFAMSLFLSTSVLSAGAFAGNVDYPVIAGAGPAASPPVVRRSHVGPPAANAAPSTYAPSQQRAPGAYGGGFLEMVVTGRDPTPRRGGEAYYNRPQDVVRGPSRAQPSQAYTPQPQPVYAPRAYAPQRQAAYATAPIAASPMQRAIDPVYLRQEVSYSGGHAPGTVVIDTGKRFLYLVQPGGRAVRYGIGVGRPGFEWAGVKTVTRKAEWPDWTPPPEMLKRRPDLPPFMKGGPENPLGARAMYLGSSLYRIHGTNEPWTIGQNVSSGCIRLMNEDVTDLYGRVRVGSKVIVM